MVHRFFVRHVFFLGLLVFQPAFAQVQVLECRDVFKVADEGAAANSHPARKREPRTLKEIAASARKAGERVQMTEHRFDQGPSVFTGLLFHPRDSRPAHAQRTLTILIHGLADSHNSMMEIAEGLFKSGDNVMVVDLPFHGADLLKRFKNNGHQEIKERDIQLDYEGFLKNLKEVVARTAQREGFENIDIFGHSLGGGMAVWLTSLFEPIRYTDTGTGGPDGAVTRDLRIRNVHLAMPFYESAERTMVKEQLVTMSGGTTLASRWWDMLYTSWDASRGFFYDFSIFPMVSGQWKKFSQMSASHQSEGLSPEQQAELAQTIKNVMHVSAKTTSGIDVRSALQSMHGANVYLLGATDDPVVNAAVLRRYGEDLAAAQAAGSIGGFAVEPPLEGSHLVPWFKPERIVQWIQSRR